VLGAIALLAVGGAAAAVLASGVLSNKSSHATTVIVRTHTQPSGGGGGAPSSGGTSTAGGSGTGGSATFNGNDYTATYPAGWEVVEQDAPVSNYTETKFQAPDGSATVLIDRTSGSPQDPAREAEAVRKQTRKTSGYQEISFQSTTLAGAPAQEWDFSLPSGERVDYFFNWNDGRYAVLGEGPDSATALAQAQATAESIAGG
jgi:hypothetical protein